MKTGLFTLILTSFCLLGGCQTIGTNSGEQQIQVVTVFDTIQVQVLDTIQIVNRIDRVVYDTLITLIKDTNIVNKVVRIVEDNVDTYLRLDTNIVSADRMMRLLVEVKDKKISVNINSIGLNNSKIEQPATILSDWWLWLLIGAGGGIIALVLIRKFAKYMFGLK